MNPTLIRVNRTALLQALVGAYPNALPAAYLKTLSPNFDRDIAWLEQSGYAHEGRATAAGVDANLGILKSPLIVEVASAEVVKIRLWRRQILEVLHEMSPGQAQYDFVRILMLEQGCDQVAGILQYLVERKLVDDCQGGYRITPNGSDIVDGISPHPDWLIELGE